MSISNERIQALIEKIYYQEKQHIYYTVKGIKEHFNVTINEILEYIDYYEYDYFYKKLCYCYFITLNIDDYESMTIHILDNGL